MSLSVPTRRTLSCADAGNETMTQSTASRNGSTNLVPRTRKAGMKPLIIVEHPQHEQRSLAQVAGAVNVASRQHFGQWKPAPPFRGAAKAASPERRRQVFPFSEHRAIGDYRNWWRTVRRPKRTRDAPPRTPAAALEHMRHREFVTPAEPCPNQVEQPVHECDGERAPLHHQLGTDRIGPLPIDHRAR